MYAMCMCIYMCVVYVYVCIYKYNVSLVIIPRTLVLRHGLADGRCLSSNHAVLYAIGISIRRRLKKV